MACITEYKSEWAESFEKIAHAIRKGLPKSCKIHHVGSTAIAGMPSKDVVDVDIECPSGTMAAVIEGLVGLGYEHQGDLSIAGREVFRALPNSMMKKLPLHHLYACEGQALELRKHLAFRDYLLAHHDRMTWLAQQKRLADHEALSRDEYIRNKAQAYDAITAESLAWAATSH